MELTTDWPALEREAARAKVAKAPYVDVRAAHGCGCNKLGPMVLKYAVWTGQVYGSLAVALVGHPPEGCCRHDATPEYGYQLLHVPTSLLIAESRDRAAARQMRVLALALGALPVDWAAIGYDGFRGGHPMLPEVKRVMNEWADRYGR